MHADWKGLAVLTEVGVRARWVKTLETNADDLLVACIAQCMMHGRLVAMVAWFHHEVLGVLDLDKPVPWMLLGNNCVARLANVVIGAI
jgi:hypothetical protein